MQLLYPGRAKACACKDYPDVAAQIDAVGEIPESVFCRRRQDSPVHRSCTRISLILREPIAAMAAILTDEEMASIFPSFKMQPHPGIAL